ncbi:MAG: thioredoxin-dependent thiol peroxidase [Anaerolineae bacterium]|nr:thioredoxin-dependent thiol peroxidase [Anaerolineae bacterium]
MVEIGEQAPDFELTSDKGEQIKLSNFLGRNVILYFYPKADTSGCTKQACALRDVYPQIVAGDAVVIGISPDPIDALVKFREKYSLPFHLLSDPDHKVAEMYGAWGDKQMYGKTYQGIIRSHFVVDSKGRFTEVKLKAQPLSTAEMALKIIEL